MYDCILTIILLLSIYIYYTDFILLKIVIAQSI